MSPAAARVVLAFLTVVYFILTALGSRRLLWHDELYTYYIASAPSLSRLWQEIHLDLNPPLQYLLARISIDIFGLNAYAVRLPSILGFLIGSLCLGHFVARRLGSPYGWLAMLVLWASPFFYYATEARPYALAMCFLGVALLAWQRVMETDGSIRWTCLLAIATTGMMLSHLMALFYVVPFCMAEVARTFRRQRVDLAVWAALLTPCIIPFVYIHLMARFESSSFPLAFQASFRKTVEFYYGSLRLEALPLMIALGLALLIAQRRGQPMATNEAAQMTTTEAALTAGFVIVPVVVSLALMRSHGAFFDRYAFPLEFGYALITVFFLANYAGKCRLAPIAACAVLLLFVCAYQLGPGMKPSVWAGTGTALRAANGRTLDQVRPELPLVAASGLQFLEMDRYADAPTVNRLYYLTDRGLAIRYARATIFEGLPALKGYFPIRAKIVPYQSFVKQHPTFLVLGTPDYPEDWLLRELVDTDAEVRYLGDFPGVYKDKQLYQVTVTAK